jgi:hypothetical protein
MRRLRKIVATGAAGLAVVSLATWVVAVAAGGQSPGDKGGDNDVNVCVGADSVLRSPESGICPNGSTRIALSGPDIKKPEPADENDPLGPTKKPGESGSDQLAALERRISNLEKSSLFEVVNKKGDLIFSVAPGRVQVYNENKAVAAILATSEGGQFVGRSADGSLSAFVGSYGERAGLRLTEGGLPRLELLRQVAGNYSFKIPSGDGVIAGIGESKAGTGALVVGDKGGRAKASMSINDGKGAVSIFNGAGSGVASLTESVNGGGLLVLTDANSYAVVKMGTNYNRYGVVMTFPPGFPYVPRSGLPGSYFMGCAAGPSCVP